MDSHMGSEWIHAWIHTWAQNGFIFQWVNTWMITWIQNGFGMDSDMD